MMRRRQVLAFAAGAAAVFGAGLLTVPAAPGAWAVPAARGAAVPAVGSWGRAIEVPGLGALNKGGNAGVDEVSCTSPGNCAAGGYYTDGHRREQGFVAAERHGVWGRAIEVPGLGALNKGANAVTDDGVNAVSCASAGNCATGGDYTNGGVHSEGFVAVEKNGRWGQAIEVPGLGALNTGKSADVDDVSCPSAGNCAVGGVYTDRSGTNQGFVAVEKNGRWGQAIEVPGLGALNKGGSTEGGAEVDAVSCASAGNCAVGGSYTDKSGNSQGFVAVEKNGVWGRAIYVPGLPALNQGGDADVGSVSCASAGGGCAAGGGYTDGGGNGQGFVVSEKDGVWGRAIYVPGLPALNAGGGGNNAEVDSVSCPSAGNCAAVGAYGEPYGGGWVAVEKNGRWGNATDVGLTGRFGGAGSVSCASPGNCAAGGDYSNADGSVVQGWVDVEQHGRWDNGIEVPGLGALNQGGGAGVGSVSCPPAGGCAAGGGYTDSHGRSQGFVVSKT